jgi:hypothetical protein
MQGVCMGVHEAVGHERNAVDVVLRAGATLRRTLQVLQPKGRGVSGPPFFSVRAAVRWGCFTAQRPLIKHSSIYSKTFHDDDLTLMDKHTQAALIVGVTERLVDKLEAAYISVVWLAPGRLTRMAAARRKNLRKLQDQRERENAAREDRMIEDGATRQQINRAIVTTVEREQMPLYFRQDADEASWRWLVNEIRREYQFPSRGLEKLVRRIRGESIGLHATRKDLRCDMNALKDIEADVRMALDRLQDRVVGRLEPAFLEKGFVVRPSTY